MAERTVPGEVAGQLYAVPPDLFIAERDKAVADARKAGDRQRAAAIAKLRKPSLAAWLVNLLALRRPELVAELAGLAGELRDAQRELRGDQLRQLSTQRRAVVAALVEQARELAVAERPDLARAKLPLAEVEATLNAALADPEVADQVRGGKLVHALAYTGFGEVPRPNLRLVTGATAERAKAPRGEERPTRAERAEAERAEAERVRAQRAEAERAVARARTGQEEAEAALARAGAAEREGGRALAKLEAELTELVRRRAAAEEELGRLKTARKSAERAVWAARRRLGEVEAALEALPAPKARRAREGRRARER